MSINEAGLLEVKQEGLIDCAIEALGLDVGTVNGNATLAEGKLLVRIHMEKMHMVTLATECCGHAALHFWSFMTRYCICC